MIYVDMVTFGLRKADSEMGFMSHVLLEYLVMHKAECLFEMRKVLGAKPWKYGCYLCIPVMLVFIVLSAFL